MLRYKTLHLSAMGAAIPLLAQLVLTLPAILPFHPDEWRVETTTGTVEVQDEMIPDDESEDMKYRTRLKSTMIVVLRIGDGVDELTRESVPDDAERTKKNTRRGGRKGHRGKLDQMDAGAVIMQEPEQDDMDQ